MPGIIGKKLGMSQVVQDDGRVIPVTFVQCEANTIVQVKTEESDGYPAIVLGFDAYKNPSKNKKFKTRREFRVDNPADYKVGDKVDLTKLDGIEKVSVTSVSKGKGYQGVIKRHNFSRGPETHGSHHHREPGSIGMCAKPGRVLKGKKMPGQMGSEKVTLHNREVVQMFADKALMAIKGCVPGANNGYVYIKF